MKNKIIYAIIAVVVVLGVAGAYVYPKSTTMIIPSVGSSSVGTVFNTAKEAAITWQPSNGATTTSILNTDANDRYIKSIQGMCTGIGTSLTAVTGGGLTSNGLTMSAATTTTSAPAVFSTATGFLQSQIIATTSSLGVYFATSTPQLQGGSPAVDYIRIWPTSTYLTFQTNATNTMTCTVGASYLGS